MLNIELINQLRSETGAGISECKKALDQSQDDLNKAIEILRKQGKKIAQSKQGKLAKEGIVQAYIHSNQKMGSLIEITCETDFVAKNQEFQELAHNIAMQVTAMNPQYLKPEEVPSLVIEKEKEIYREQLKKEKKPAAIIEKILEGKIQKYFEDVCLLKQPFIKDENITIEDLITQKIAKLGEKIEIKRFVRYGL